MLRKPLWQVSIAKCLVIIHLPVQFDVDNHPYYSRRKFFRRFETVLKGYGCIKFIHLHEFSFAFESLIDSIFLFFLHYLFLFKFECYNKKRNDEKKRKYFLPYGVDVMRSMSITVEINLKQFV